jgi:cytidyltransferase-like protein
MGYMGDLYEKVMVFGVFDGLHDGHRFFINEARKHGKNLIIVVTPDDTVKFMKGEPPRFTLLERIQVLEKEFPKAQIMTGDDRKGVWSPIKSEKPDAVILGYDQNSLKSALKGILDGYDFDIIQVKEDFDGKRLHSRFIHKRA